MKTGVNKIQDVAYNGALTVYNSVSQFRLSKKSKLKTQEVQSFYGISTCNAFLERCKA